VKKPAFFPTPTDFRRWLQKHHASAEELLVGFYKTTSGKPSITWPESVDEALCFGWIDGRRTRIDDTSYTIRFTPRRTSSIWSAINMRRVEALIEANKMMPAGLAAFEARRANKVGVYSYEQRPDSLIEPYASMLAKNAKARDFFASQAPSYRRAATWWVISAKRDETRLSRARTLIELSAKRQPIPQFTKWKPRAK
jgi:uncharacterized protein YdeI (YjbR/CyaY-like superfamily)